MGDVADILGLGDGSLKAAAAAAGGNARKQLVKKPDGMSREVFALLGPSSLPSLVPSGNVAEDMKTKKGVPAQKWSWAKFVNSARADGLEMEHWQRDSNANNDYAFAKFNKKTAVVQYVDEEYQYLVAPQDEGSGWTKEETDILFKMCDMYDLRWYIIEDRWPTQKQERSVTDLKARYYGVCKTILLARRNKKSLKAIQKQTVTTSPAQQDGVAETQGGSAVVAEGSTGPEKQIPNTARVTAKAMALVENAIAEYTFDKAQDEKRVAQLALLFSRTVAEEKEEANLVNEIRRIDVQLRRLQKEAPKRSGKQKSAVPALQHFPPTLMESLLNDEKVDWSDQSKKGPGVSLRSDRLRICPSQIGIGSRIQLKMDSLLTEVGVPIRPTPTVKICNALDKLRQDTVKLLALQAKLFDLKGELSVLQGNSAPLRPGQTKARTKKQKSNAQEAGQVASADPESNLSVGAASQSTVQVASAVSSTLNTPVAGAMGTVGSTKKKSSGTTKVKVKQETTSGENAAGAVPSAGGTSTKSTSQNKRKSTSSGKGASSRKKSKGSS